MATRMQQRRGTAAQWTSTNNGDGPVLEVGEIGFESDTGKFKIGDGINHWIDLDYFLDESDISGITGDYVLANTLGQANGVATLDSQGKITSSQIPSSLASTSYVDTAISNLANSAPALLDTLNELSEAINDDPTFFTTVANNLSTHASDTTNVHGIADTAELATKEFAANLLINATKSNITITGNKDGLTITAENGVADSTTSDLAEGTNLYFTNERAQDAVGNVVGTGLAYDDNTGAISTNNIPNSSLANSAVTINGFSISLGGSASYSSDNIGEGTTNLYFTNARAQAAVSADISSAINALSTTDIEEGTNQYFTNARVRAAVDGGTGLDYNVSTGQFDIDSTVTTNSGEQTLTNKTLTSPVINGATIGGNVIPSSDGVYNLGSPTNKFKDLYLSGTTLYLDAATIGLHSNNIQIAHSGNTTIIPVGNGNHTVATQTDLATKASLSGAAFTGNVSTTGSLTVDGNFTVNGSNVLVSATQIQIEDSILQLAHQNPANTVDLGIVAGYNDGSAKHAGLVKDATDGKWKLFDGVTDEPSTTVNFAQATLDDLVVGGLETSTFSVANATVTGTITAGGGVGTNGQFLQSTGSGIQWATVDALPPQSGNSGKYLTTNGTSASWVTIQTGYVPIPTTSVSSNINISSNNRYFVDTSATRTLTLPASPIAGDEVQVFDVSGSAATNAITVNSNGNKINGTVQNLEIDLAFDAVSLIYTGSTYGWKVI